MVENKTDIRIYAFFIILGILIVGCICSFYINKKSNNLTEKEPDEVELMTYAQEVLDSKLINTKYSYDKNDYEYVKTDLQYKIIGYVNNEKFWMVIRFSDNTYKEYQLISLQIGQKKIY